MTVLPLFDRSIAGGVVPASTGQDALGEADRVRLAASPRTAPGVLLTLASDPSVKVRAAAAMNPACRVDADQRLVLDADERVRTLLGRRLGGMLSGLTEVRQQRLRAHALFTLDTLVRDEAMRVRAAIADVIAALPDVPKELVLRLAHDTASAVCEPVIRLSPLLSPADLLGLVLAPPGAGTLRAVAGRPDLDPETADALAASDDAAAIAVLLANPTAAIREATVDALVERAAGQESWHGSLVRRPTLSPGSARRLIGFVTAALLDEMLQRADIPPELARDIRQRLGDHSPARDGRGPEELSLQEAIDQAEEMLADYRLDEQALHSVITRGEARLATAMLAVAAGLAAELVDRAVTLRNAKALVSLVWKAGFTMRIAVPLQGLLANLPPNAVLAAGPANSFPLAVEEMRWQIECLNRSGH